jgi:DNA-binding transcriptional MerR regulator
LSRTYSIQELTRELGVTARTLRHYEAEGLITPGRRGNVRIYSARERARLTLILRGRRVGFSLAEIRDNLDLYDARGGEAQLLDARCKFAERIESLERQRADIEESLAELRLGLTMIDNQLAERAPRPVAPVKLTGFGLMPAEE